MRHSTRRSAFTNAATGSGGVAQSGSTRRRRGSRRSGSKSKGDQQASSPLLPADPMAAASLSLKAALSQVGADIDRRLDVFLAIPDDPRANLYRAMRHSAIGGGK